jgi:Family of unknown function (DUF6348)
VADNGCLTAQARIGLHSSTPTGNSVQLDLEVRTQTGHRILESCGGFGKTFRDAVGDAIKNFSDGSFHVIYSATTGHSCSHCEEETWEIGGNARRVLISPMVYRGFGGFRPGGPAPIEWFRVMGRHIKECGLTAGLHWIRLYHFESPTAQDTVSEVLLNNEVRPDLQKVLATYDWPHSGNGFYSVRIFMMILEMAG